MAMTNEQIEAAKRRTVRKSNVLVKNSKYYLPVLTQKLICFLVSRIKADDKKLEACQFTVMDFCKICEIDNDSGSNYKDVKNAVKFLADTFSLWIPINGKEKLIRWIEEAEINPNSGEIKVKLNYELSEHLINLVESGNYTSYQLSRILGFRGKYSIRAYEYICSVHYHPETKYICRISIEDLRNKLGVKNDVYAQYKNLKSRVINPTFEEINAVSDKNVEIEEIKSGNTVTGLTLSISTKESTLTAGLPSPPTPAARQPDKPAGAKQKRQYSYRVPPAQRPENQVMHGSDVQADKVGTMRKLYSRLQENSRTEATT